VIKILEGILKGLLQWLYGLMLEVVEYIANNLLDVFSMDLAYFESALPAANDIFTIILATGWALLLGNLVFQASKSMMTGLGFEGEDPKTLFARTFVFAFLLLASRQTCDIGLGISQMLITLLQIPSSVSIHTPSESFFNIGASWILVLIVGVVLMWQIVKLFFAVGERYFLMGVLTLLAPWAFAMGGSRSTAEIFKGWARMFCTMCLMMVLNVVFLKILLNAMGIMPSGLGVVAWLIFIVAITRAAKKIDGVILRIGLSPSNTGGQGRGLPGMLSFAVMRAATTHIMQAAGNGTSDKYRTPPKGGPKPPGAQSAGTGGASNRGSPSGGAAYHSAAVTQNSGGSPQSPPQPSVSNTAKPAAGNVHDAPARAQTPQQSQAQPPHPAAPGNQKGAAHTVTNSPETAAPTPGGQAATGSHATSINTGAAGAAPHTPTPLSASSPGAAERQTPAQLAASGLPPRQALSTIQNNSSRRSSVSKSSSASSAGNARNSVFSAGAAGNAARVGNAAQPIHPPIPRSGPADKATSPAAMQPAPQGSPGALRPTRYSSVPPSTRAAQYRTGAPGAAGMQPSPLAHQGGASMSTRNQADIIADQNNSRNDANNLSNRESMTLLGQNAGIAARSPAHPTGPGAAGARITTAPADKPKGAIQPQPTPLPTQTPVSPACAAGITPTPVKPAVNPAERLRAERGYDGAQRMPELAKAERSVVRGDETRQGETPQRKTNFPETVRTPAPGISGKAARPVNTPYPVRKPDMVGTRQSATAANSSARISKPGANSRKKAKGMRGKKYRR